MLDQVTRPAKPAEFDAAAYIRDMRAGGFGVAPMQSGKNLGFALIPGRGFRPLPPEVVDRWHGAFAADPQAEAAVWTVLDDERRMAEAKALIGDDVQKGVDEVRRVRAVKMAAYEAENRFFIPRNDPPFAVWTDQPGALEAEQAAEEGFKAYECVVSYVRKMPVRSMAEVIAKARFAIECDAEGAADELNEGFSSEALRQIVEFLAPQELLLAAE